MEWKVCLSYPSQLLNSTPKVFWLKPNVSCTSLFLYNIIYSSTSAYLFIFISSGHSLNFVRSTAFTGTRPISLPSNGNATRWDIGQVWQRSVDSTYSRGISCIACYCCTIHAVKHKESAGSSSSKVTSRQKRSNCLRCNELHWSYPYKNHKCSKCQIQGHLERQSYRNQRKYKYSRRKVGNIPTAIIGTM